MADEVMQALAQALSPYLGGNKGFAEHVPWGFKASGSPSNTAYLYETGGLFGRCGVGMNKVEIARQPGEIDNVGLGDSSGRGLNLKPNFKFFKVHTAGCDGHIILHSCYF